MSVVEKNHQAPSPGWRANERSLLASRTGLVLAAAAVVGVGLALEWDWLAALGVTPLILSLLPCAVMCAVGVCMMGKGGRSCGTGGSARPRETK